MATGGGVSLDLSEPPSALAALARRAEEAGLRAAASPRETAVDGWLIRLSPGAAKRSRCVNAISSSGELPLDDLLARCRRSFSQAGLPLIFRLTPFSRPVDLDQCLADRHWQAFDAADVMVLPELRATMSAPDPQLEALSPQAYAAAIGSLRGSTSDEINGQATRLLAAPVPHQAFCLRGDDPAGQALSYGQIAVDGEIVGLFDIFTPPEHRGRGHGQRLCAALLQVARRQGAREAYLQVGASNATAQRVYQRLGFLQAYRYHYRSDDPAAWA